MDSSVTICGITLKSPLVVGSGPIGYAAEGMIRASNHGAGAVVTKTIRDTPAENPYPHIAVSERSSMINAEKWTDFSGERWVETEIPAAKAAGVVVIGSIGHTVPEVEHWVPGVDRAGADIIELVSYREETILAMVQRARELTDKPILVKISPNWSDPVSAALQSISLGADGITAMDSIGPVLRIDITTQKPLVGGPFGSGWLTGAAIKPVALHYVARIALQTDKPIIGLGGVMTPEDGIEMLMAGASAIGVCTAPMLKGLPYLGVLNERITRLADSLGFRELAEVRGAALPNLIPEENMYRFDFRYVPETCTACNKCVIVCPYQARNLDLKTKEMNLDAELCRFCGLCASVCPTGALTLAD